ncbi:hypothetical protein GTA08_BOTSDO11672 [Botryosphaeria dothidea]|uniref:Uncharacterized protein n=1 Tax=Botryosphaeria dothidea TaxID=55169 RepID=A0A8H4J4D2_9PEZI|nr:hypothetical protein GTA08_BOTSDO11672 [Botryosphaeria dothidea]
MPNGAAVYDYSAMNTTSLYGQQHWVQNLQGSDEQQLPPDGRMQVQHLNQLSNQTNRSLRYSFEPYNPTQQTGYAQSLSIAQTHHFRVVASGVTSQPKTGHAEKDNRFTRPKSTIEREAELKARLRGTIVSSIKKSQSPGSHENNRGTTSESGSRAPGPPQMPTRDDVEQLISEEKNKGLSDRARESSRETGEISETSGETSRNAADTSMSSSASDRAAGLGINYYNINSAPDCSVSHTEEGHIKPEYQKYIPQWLEATGLYDSQYRDKKLEIYRAKQNIVRSEKELEDSRIESSIEPTGQLHNHDSPNFLKLSKPAWDTTHAMVAGVYTDTAHFQNPFPSALAPIDTWADTSQTRERTIETAL